MTTETRRSGGTRDGVSPRLLVGAALTVLAVVFILQNTASGRVHLLFWDIRAPAWAWLLVLFGAGVVVGSLFPWLRHRSRR